jgi:hypothetical protein
MADEFTGPLGDYLADVARLMLEAGHQTTWATFRSERGAGLVFLTLAPDTAAHAAETLGAAGLLCETTIRRGDIPLGRVQTADVVVGLVDGLRALGSGGPGLTVRADDVPPQTSSRRGYLFVQDGQLLFKLEDGQTSVVGTSSHGRRRSLSQLAADWLRRLADRLDPDGRD